MPYRKHARVQYRFFSAILSALSQAKPLFRLALKLLTREKHQVRGHILPLYTPIGTPEQSPLGRDVIERLIERSTAIAAMNECLCRTVGGCKDYPVDLGCLVLGDAVNSLHPDLGRIIGREEALAIVDRALGLRLVPMVIHLRSDALLWSLEHSRMLTICFCCPCHCLMRAAIGGQKDGAASHVTGLPGVAVTLDAEKCTGCGRCAPACFTGVLEMKLGKPSIDRDRCVACGRCAMACARGALTVEIREMPDAAAIMQEYENRTESESVFNRP